MFVNFKVLRLNFVFISGFSGYRTVRQEWYRRNSKRMGKVLSQS